jgi:Ca2+-binding RTX toxin-like protein
VPAQGRTLSGLIAVAVTLLAAPGAADAAVSCERTAAVLDVTLSSSGDVAIIEPDVGTILVADEFDNGVACMGGTPTVSNTDAITVHNAPGLANNQVWIFNANLLVPGVSDEPGTNEIETFVNLNGGVGSGFRIRSDVGGGTFVFGGGGININATALEDVPDADVTFTTFTPSSLGGFGLAGPDFMSAQGGSGTGLPLSQDIQLSGESGNDTLIGGGGNDTIGGGVGPDDLEGGGGDDFVDGWEGENVALSGGAGDDRLLPGAPGDPVAGGDGADTVNYSFNLTAGATFDDPSGGLGIETVIGTPFNDVLRGGPEPEFLQGLDGNDTLEGRGGNDTLEGNANDDSLDVRDGGPDTADCGDGADAAIADAQGTDTLSACESVAFLPDPDPGPGGGAGPSNDFSFGKVKKNKRNGTAKLTVDVPGPGTLDLTGKRLKPASNQAGDAGKVKLTVKAKGKKKRKLNRTGRVKVKPAVTYTPTGGTSNTQSKKVRLVKR